MNNKLSKRKKKNKWFQCNYFRWRSLCGSWWCCLHASSHSETNSKYYIILRFHIINIIYYSDQHYLQTAKRLAEAHLNSCQTRGPDSLGFLLGGSGIFALNSVISKTFGILEMLPILTVSLSCKVIKKLRITM